MRGNEIQKDILEGMVEGTRKRGRPRKSWMGDIRVVTWTGKSRVELSRAAQDRTKWRNVGVPNFVHLYRNALFLCPKLKFSFCK